MFSRLFENIRYISDFFPFFHAHFKNTDLPAFFVPIIITALGVYAARVLYFAVLEEARIPIFLTWTVVGLVSFIGYTPDIFSGPLIGYYLDNWKGEQGHQYVFGLLILFSLLGLAASIIFNRINRN